MDDDSQEPENPIESIPDQPAITTSWFAMFDPTCLRCGGFPGRHHRFCAAPVSDRFVHMAIEAGQSKLTVVRSDYAAWPWAISDGSHVAAVCADNQTAECFAAFLQQLPVILDLILELGSLPHANAVIKRQQR